VLTAYFPSEAPEGKSLATTEPNSDLPSDSQIKSNIPVKISKPTKRSEGYGRNYIAYTLTSCFEDQKFEVFRRYSDFEALRQSLKEKLPGIIIPPLPEKSMLGRFEGEFVNQRMRGLERFMTRVMTHSKLKSHPYVKKFLCEQQVSKAISGKPTAKKALSMLSGFGSAVLTKFVSESPIRKETEEDKTHKEVQNQVIQFHVDIGKLHATALDLAKREKDLSKTWLGMGKCMVEVGRGEVQASEEKFGGLLGRIGKCCDRMSVYGAQSVDDSLINLVEPLKDYVLLSESVKEMLAHRKNAIEKLELALRDHLKKEAAIKKLEDQGVTGQKVADAKKAEQESKVCIDEQKKEVASITRSMLEEIERFRCEKKKDFRVMFEAFVKNQIEKAKRQQQAWEVLMGKIQGMSE